MVPDSKKKVTAIITTCRREAVVVERAVKSVLSQTYQNIELLIVDDNSDEDIATYGIQDLAGKYADSGVVYLTYPGNRGANYARNYGLAHAEGEFTAYLDDDDEWLPEKTEKQIEKFTDDSIGLVYCRRKTLYEETGKEVNGPVCKYKGEIYSQLIFDNFVGSMSFVMLRTDAVRKVGGFDEAMLSAQDYDMWLRIALKYKVDFVNEILVIYHVHGSERISSNPSKKIQGVELINQKNSDYLQKNRKARWIRNLKLSPYYVSNGEVARGVKVWLQSSLICPGEVYTNLKYLKFVLRSYRSYKRNKKAGK